MFYGTELRGLKNCSKSVRLKSDFGCSPPCCVFLSQSTCANTQMTCTLMRTHTRHMQESCSAASTQSIWWIFNIFSKCQWSLFTSVTTKSLLGFKEKKKKAEWAKWNGMQSSLRYWTTLTIWRRLLRETSLQEVVGKKHLRINWYEQQMGIKLFFLLPGPLLRTHTHTHTHTTKAHIITHAHKRTHRRLFACI